MKNEIRELKKSEYFKKDEDIFKIAVDRIENIYGENNEQYVGHKL